MIESGTHAPGVAAAEFKLPPHTALRYERPTAELRPFFASYAVFDSDADKMNNSINWLPPGWATIWIVLAERPAKVTVRSRQFGPLASPIVFGVTSRAMPVVTNGGATIMVAVKPLGWARFFAESAEQFRDRVVPLDELAPGSWSPALIAMLAASDQGPAVKGILDRFFLDRLPLPHAEEPLVAQITALLADPSPRDLVQSASTLGLSAQAMVRLTKRHFGFPPKMLIMRARFLRAFDAMILSDRPPGPALLQAGYHDASHFSRDSVQFLGMTPRRFLAMDLSYLRAVVRARSLVLGASRSVALK
jgi:AraC-like DNA-binding protein